MPVSHGLQPPPSLPPQPDEFDDASGQRRTSVLFAPIRQKPTSSDNEWSVSPGVVHRMPKPHGRQKRSLSTVRLSLTS